MYFPDLSPYAYERPPAAGGPLNIGWLDAEHPFPRGTIPNGVLAKLEAQAIAEPMNQMRGFHYCELCDREEIAITAGSRQRLLGSAEIWVRGAHGVVYAAPDLIIHYIREHEYLPPREFLDAVLALQ